MAAPQNFRSAFNGFHKEDVVHYLEYLNTKHTTQVNQLNSEIDYLRTKLAMSGPDQSETIAALEQERDELRAQVAQLLAKQDDQEAAAPAAAVPAPTPSDELEAYRRAERTERLARERAELIYHQATSVLDEAMVKVDGATADLCGIADQVLAQLQQLQASVASSKQAMTEASSIIAALRPENQ